MAKKAKTNSPASSNSSAGVERPLNERDRRTMDGITRLANDVVTLAEKRRDLHLDIPARALSNVKYNKTKRFIEMGSNTNRRQLFNLSQAKAYMQSLLVASGCKKLLASGKNSSIRSLFYTLKHTIPGANEETFNTQDECDPIIEDLEVMLNSLREELHLFAEKRGDLVGDITIIDRGDEIDCTRMGSGGYGIPSIVEPEAVQFKKCSAKFVLHVEKGTVWQRFNEDKFWKKHNCLLTHGNGQPPRGVRRLLNRFHNELGLPIYCLLDNDPWGYYIYSVIKQGSINLAYESKRMAIPDAKYLGLRSIDYDRYQLSKSVQIALNDNDKKRARQIAEYPWFAGKKAWQKEIEQMLQNGFKMEVESLANQDVSYVTEVYTPARLAEQDWLD